MTRKRELNLEYYRGKKGDDEEYAGAFLESIYANVHEDSIGNDDRITLAGIHAQLALTDAINRLVAEMKER